MKSTEFQSSVSCNTHFSTMLNILNQKLRRLCSRLRWPIRRRSKPKIIIRKFGKSTSKSEETNNNHHGSPTIINQNGDMGSTGGTVKKFERSIRVATFNAAMFSMAPAVPKVENSIVFDYGEDDEEEDCLKKKINKHSMELDIRAKSVNDRPKGILKQSPLHPNSVENCTSTTTTTTTTAENHSSRKQNFAKSRLRVSINLPDNEISLERSRQLNSASSKDEKDDKNSNRNLKGKGPLRSSRSLPSNNSISRDYLEGSFRSNRTILEVLREVDADILALQDVKAEEEKGMKPLSDLASALGMKYVFAESWAPEYGNAVLSKWPIKKWHVQKIFDDTDFRNVLKVTVDVPRVGEINFDCTHLDHLDENWRMKQINAIIKSNSTPHILAGGLNSLEDTDYSAERWTDIVKYYEEIGKPTPKVEVMKFLKGMKYVDSKDFAGECESVVMIAKGQNVQGTCKYGTRVDYILTSEESPYKFVPGSYSVLSSKGTSDHHIVKVDIVKVENNEQENVTRQRRKPKQKVVKMTNNSSMSKGIWKIST